jgi:hypothetical protein
MRMHAQIICGARFSELMRCETRLALHRALRRGLQQFLQLLFIERRIAGREMSAGFGAGRDQVKPPVLDSRMLLPRNGVSRGPLSGKAYHAMPGPPRDEGGGRQQKFLNMCLVRGEYRGAI